MKCLPTGDSVVSEVTIMAKVLAGLTAKYNMFQIA